MKTNLMKFAIQAVLILSVLFMAACPSELNISTSSRAADVPAGMGVVRLSVSNNAMRTVYPADTDNFVYSVSFTTTDTSVPSGDRVKTANLTDGKGDITLLAGVTWTGILYAKLPAAADPIGSGEIPDFTVENGETKVIGPVFIGPIVKAGDTGTLDWKITFPDDVTDAKIYWGTDSFDLLAGGKKHTGTIPLPTGSYVFRAVLTSPKGFAGKTEAVHIYKDLATVIDWDFPDFVSTRTLTANVDIYHPAGISIVSLAVAGKPADTHFIPPSSGSHTYTFSVPDVDFYETHLNSVSLIITTANNVLIIPMGTHTIEHNAVKLSDTHIYALTVSSGTNGSVNVKVIQDIGSGANQTVAVAAGQTKQFDLLEGYQVEAAASAANINFELVALSVSAESTGTSTKTFTIPAYDVSASASFAPRVTGVTLDRTTVTLDIGAKTTLIATVAPATAAHTDVTWSSSAPAIATVADGVVTAVAQGSATITATTVGLLSTGLPATRTCAVTVNPPPAVFADIGFGYTAKASNGLPLDSANFDRMEAENATKKGGNENTAGRFSNGKGWSDIPAGTLPANIQTGWPVATGTTHGYLQYTINKTTPGNYQINIMYSGDNDKTILVKLNDNPVQRIDIVNHGSERDWSDVFTRQIVVGPFRAGSNTLYLSGSYGASGTWMDHDCIDVKKTPETLPVPRDAGYFQIVGYGATVTGGSTPLPVLSGYTRYEAENTAAAQIVGSARPQSEGWFSSIAGTEPQSFYSTHITPRPSGNGGAAAGLNKAGSAANGMPWDWTTTNHFGYIRFYTVNVAQAGNYRVDILYNGNDGAELVVKLNNNKNHVVTLPQQTGGAGAWNKLMTRQIVLGPFTAGVNTIWVSGVIGSGWVNIDCIDVRNTPEADAALVNVTSVTLDKTTLSLTIGDAPVQLIPTVVPSNATYQAVSWSSNNPAVATVDSNGNVKAVSNGSATITVTTEGKMANGNSATRTCSVTVALGTTTPAGWIGSNDALYVDENGYVKNQLGNEVVLRGVNLGGWLIQESWMCPVYGADNAWANLDTINAMTSRGFSAAQIQELFDTYQDNWITEEDFDFFKARGVNSVRIPFWYRNFMSDEAGTWIGDNGSTAVTNNPGFKRLDWAIYQAKKRGMYVILDLHGVPGGQSTNHCSGTLAKNEFWTNTAYQNVAINLWKAIAGRYKNEATVAVYDLLNEPQNNGNNTGTNNWAADSVRAVYETVRVYDILYREVRAVDPGKILMMEGIWSMNLPDPKYVHSGGLNTASRHSGKTVVWNNVMYSMHLYDSSTSALNSRINELANARTNWKVAVHVGEFNNGDTIQASAYTSYNTNKFSWNMWTYKVAGANKGNWSIHQGSTKTNVDPRSSGHTFEQIKQHWGTTLRTFNTGTTTLASGWSQQSSAYNWYTTGQSHTLTNVFTNSNQSGFPVGGTLGPIN